MVREERADFISGSLKIEGLLARPEESGPHPAAVVCHPHPQFGGDMHNNVVTHVSTALQKERIVSLRFNFRGVGSSEGSYANGEGEMEDVHGAIDFLKNRPFIDTARLFVIGYSFGAWIGLRVAHERRDLSGLVGISPPLAMYKFDFLENDSKPKLLIVGDRDFVCPVESAKALYSALSEPKEIELISGADHFLWGYEEEIGKGIARFIIGVCTKLS